MMTDRVTNKGKEEVKFQILIVLWNGHKYSTYKEPVDSEIITLNSKFQYDWIIYVYRYRYNTYIHTKEN